MPWESIGDVDTNFSDASWVEFARKFAIMYIKHVCDSPTEGCEIGIAEHDHDNGSCSTIGICYDFSYPQDYIRICEQTLDVFNRAVDWKVLQEHYEKTAFPDKENEAE